MRQVIDNIYQIQFVPFVNGYVIEQGDSLTLIDTGLSASSTDKLEKALQKRGKSLADIGHILITHAHPDHIGGLASLQSRCGEAQTIAHRRDAFVIRGEKEQVVAPRSELKGLAWLMSIALGRSDAFEFGHVSKDVEEGVTLDNVLPSLQVIELVGHSHGQIGFWWPEKRLLFGGDVMMNMPWGLRMPLRAPSPDWNTAKQSIKKVADMNVDILCLGHGKPIVGDAAAKVQKLASRL